MAVLEVDAQFLARFILGNEFWLGGKSTRHIHRIDQGGVEDNRLGCRVNIHPAKGPHVGALHKVEGGGDHRYLGLLVVLQELEGGGQIGLAGPLFKDPNVLQSG